MITEVTVEPEVEDSDVVLAAYDHSVTSRVHECTIEDVTAFENAIVDTELNQRDEINARGLIDKLVGGMYCRVLHIQKGTFFTGKVHHRPYIDIFISGDMTVKSFHEDGRIESAQRFTKTQFFEGIPGRKRVIYAHEDCIWVTVDPTKETEKDKAEDDTLSFQFDGFKKYLEGV